MARSPQYWYDYMIAEKQTNSNLNKLVPNPDTNQTLLNDLTTPSKVADWRLWIWVVATCAYALDVVFDLALIAFEELSKSSRFGTLPWYINKAYEFQYGNSLVFQNNEFQYATVTPANQIIKRAAAQENGNIVNIKIAKLVANVPAKLNPTEKTAADTYFNTIKPAGITLNIISDDPDELRLYIKVNYDALVLDNLGQLLTASGTFPVEDTINNFLQSVIFDGTLELCNLIDQVQATIGVKSAYILAASARYGANPYTTFTERYYPNAGHMKIDPTTPLSTTLSYQAI